MRAPTRPPAAPPGDRQSARTTQDELNIALTRKARLETRVAARSLTRRAWLREFLASLASAGTLLIALATAVGGGFTIYRWLEDRASERELRTEERLTRILADMTSKDAAQRMGAVATVGLYLDRDNQPRNKQIMLSLANAVSTEEDLLIQRTMIDLLRSVDHTLVDAATLGSSLRVILNYDRALVASQGIYAYRGGGGNDPRDVTIRRLMALAEVIVHLHRNGGRVQDFSGVYLADTSLAGLDLSGTSFRSAILEFADFSGAVLTGADFSQANITSASFNKAKLQKAVFDYSEGPRRTAVGFTSRSHYSGEMQGAYRASFLTELARNIALKAAMPDFRCADLRGAVFRRFPLGYMTDENFSAIPFAGADLRGADLDPVLLNVGERPMAEAFPSNSTWRAAGSGSASVWVVEPDSYEGEADHAITDAVADSMFEGTGWKQLKGAGWFRSLLESESPAESESFEGRCA
jgi:uncharacterized protein YjbI with pentapeptide repeats